jgi:hypothetical protein
MKDLIKLTAFALVHGTPIYAKKYVGLDTGKSNFESYFVGKKGWSNNRLKKAVKALRESGVLNKETTDGSCVCFSVFDDKRSAKLFLSLVAN